VARRGVGRVVPEPAVGMVIGAVLMAIRLRDN
jgi:hypothetical protein